MVQAYCITTFQRLDKDSQAAYTVKHEELLFIKAELHFAQTREVSARKIVESKQDPDLVTVAVDLNVKFLAVITVRQRNRIIESRYVRDKGLDQQRYRHLKRIAKKQWLFGKPVRYPT